MYFVIRNSDGETYVERMSADKLEKHLNEADYGNVEFLSSIPDMDTNLWPEGSILIIRGEIAVPTPVEVVRRFSLSDQER